MSIKVSGVEVINDDKRFLNNEERPEILPSLNLDFARTKTLDPRIDFTRGSIGTYYDAKGRLVTAASGEPRFDHDPDTLECKGLLIEEQRTNLLTHSEQFDNAAWSKGNTTISANATTAPDGATTADKLVENTASGQHYAQENISFVAGTSYTLSCYVKAAEYDSVKLQLNTAAFGQFVQSTFALSGEGQATVTSAGTNTSANIVYVGNGWYRCSLISEATATSVSQAVVMLLNDASSSNYTGDGTSGIYIWGAQLEAGAFPTSYIPSTETFTSRASTATYYDSTGTLQTAAVDEERLTYNPADLTAPATQLFEPQRTNLMTYSEEFGNAAWAAGLGTTIFNNTTTAPDGTTTADSITLAGEGQSVYQSVAVSASTMYTASCYVKLGTLADSDYKIAVYNNTATTFIAADIVPTKIDVGNDWYRMEYAFTTPSGCTSIRFYPFRNGATTGTATLYLWGAQLEAGAYPTSYIPTTSSTVTRSADVYSSATSTRSADSASMTGDNFSEWYKQGEGTVYAESSVYSNNSKTQGVWDLDGSINLRSPQSSVNKIRAYFAGVFSVNNAGAQIPEDNYIKSTVSWDGLSARLQSDSTGEDITGTTSSTPTEFWIGSLDGGTPLNGCIRKLTYYPKRLPNATLQAMTEE